MNMKKILAAGVAATVAASSLAAIVSAEDVVATISYGESNGVETKTFDMQKTIGSVKVTLTGISNEYKGAKNLGKKFYLTDEQFNGTKDVAPKKLVTIKGEGGSEATQKELADAKEALEATEAIYAAAVLEQTAAEADLEKAQKAVTDLEAAKPAALTALETAQAAKEAAWATFKNVDEDDDDFDDLLAAYAEKWITYFNAKVDYEGGTKLDLESADSADVENLDPNGDFKPVDGEYDFDILEDDDGNEVTVDAATAPKATYGKQIEEAKAAADAAITKAADAKKDTEAAEALVKAAQEVVDAAQKKLDGEKAIGLENHWIAEIGINCADYMAVPVELLSGSLANAFKNGGGSFADDLMTLKVTGVKGTRTATSHTYEYKLKYKGDYKYTDKTTGKTYTGAYILPIYAGTSPADSFLPEQFLEITSLEVGISSAYVQTIYGITEDTYNYLLNDDSGLTADQKATKSAALKNELTKAGASFNADWWINPWNCGGGASLSIVSFENNAGDELLKEIEDIFLKTNGVTYTFSDKAANPTYAFLPVTTAVGTSIYRNEVWLLSRTGATNSATAYFEGGYQISGDQVAGTGQTYDDRHDGTIPNWFGGLASQVADWFNHKDNGKIIFHFGVPASTSSTSDWKYGGVPSTEVGIKNMLSASQANDFALFVNYGSTTGSLQAATVIDATSGSVEFILDDILEALSYQTIGTVQDIYYGLNKGICDYSNTIKVPGMFVTSIEFQSSENADVEADVEEEDNDVEPEEDTDVVDDIDEEDDIDEDDEDDFVEEDDDDEPEDVDDEEDDYDDEDDFVDDVDDEDDFVDVDDDEDDYVEPTVDDEESAPDAEIDDDVAGDTTANTPVVIDNGNTKEVDANPGTGVGLAVVPAIVAAAALAISKKRK